jgi:hypothetical protein
VGRDAVLNVATPEPYAAEAGGNATAFPVSHSRFLDEVTEALAENGWEIGETAFALRDGKVQMWGREQYVPGADLFALIGVNHKQIDLLDHQAQYVMAVRNSHAKKFAAKGSLGVGHFVCDNLVFSASRQIMQFGRRHTRFIDRDLPRNVRDGMSNMLAQAADVQRRYDHLQATELSDKAGRVLLTRAAELGCVPWSRAGKVLSEWTREDGCGGHDVVGFNDRSAMRFLNSVTEIERENVSAQTPKRNSRLMGLLDHATGFEPTLAVTA